MTIKRKVSLSRDSKKNHPTKILVLSPLVAIVVVG